MTYRIWPPIARLSASPEAAQRLRTLIRAAQTTRLASPVELALVAVLLLLALVGCATSQPSTYGTLCGTLTIDGTRVAVVVDLAQPKTWSLNGAQAVSLTLYPCRRAVGEVAP